jgi:hypothetical protein
MPKPKLSEEDKKEVVPLRLPKDAIAAVDRIADNWTERKGKEIKRATVARELVLIGLGAFQAMESSPIFTEHEKRQRPSQAKISLTTEEEDLITRFHRLPSESQGLVKQLLATTKNTPIQNKPPDDRYPDEFVMEDREEDELPATNRKGGRH